MMIKANGEYLDFNGDIEIESRIKLFEEINTSNGDFSYDIQIQDNGFNRKILGIPRADTIKSIYQAVPSEVIDDTGQSIYLGKLQVNRISGGVISSTFYAGNTEWFAELSEPLSSLPLYRYDVDFTIANVALSFLQNDGIVFPIIDTGAIVSRSFSNLKVEDFISCFYVKTLFNEIFNPKGIKVVGDFIEDPTFKKLVVASNGRSQDEVKNRSSYVNKTTAQNNQAGPVTITFQDDSTFPFNDGSQDNFNITTSEYTADVKMRIQTSVVLSVSSVSGGPGFSVFNLNYIINGSFYKNFSYQVNTTGGTLNRDLDIILEAGDVFEIGITVTGGNNLNIASGSLKITPIYIYKVFGVSSVPNWTQMEFVSNILRLFNVLPSYDTTSKTLTLDLFNNIKNKPYVDISQEVTVDTVDFSEFVSSYAKNNYFKYQESDEEDLREYNISNFISYGSGNLTIDNDYIENSKDVVESDFTSPITYLNGVFDMSMERINYVELDEIYEKPITNVSDSSGTPRFSIATASTFFAAGDLVRIETDLDSYDGEWIVNNVTGTYIEINGPTFDAATTGTITLLRHKFTTNDGVYLFINMDNLEPTTLFSSKSSLLFDASTNIFNASVAYFNLLNNNTAINRIYKQSLSFGEANDPLAYQLTLLETYWPLFSRILSDPVMLLSSGYLKKSTFEKIKTFLRPVMIQTEETRNLYYMNRNRGYKGSERPCELELIKLN